MNSPMLYDQNILVHLQKVVGDKTGLGGTTLNYLAVYIKL